MPRGAAVGSRPVRCSPPRSCAASPQRFPASVKPAQNRTQLVFPERRKQDCTRRSTPATRFPRQHWLDRHHSIRRSLLRRAKPKPQLATEGARHLRFSAPNSETFLSRAHW